MVTVLKKTLLIVTLILTFSVISYADNSQVTTSDANYSITFNGDQITLSIRTPCFVVDNGNGMSVQTISDMTKINGKRVFLASYQLLHKRGFINGNFFVAESVVNGKGEWDGNVTFTFTSPFVTGFLPVVNNGIDPVGSIWDALWLPVDAFYVNGRPAHLCIPFDEPDHSVPAPQFQFMRPDILSRNGIELYYIKPCTILPVNYLTPSRFLRDGTHDNIYTSFPPPACNCQTPSARFYGYYN